MRSTSRSSQDILEEGRQILSKADNDSDILGRAVVSIDSALISHLRSVFSTQDNDSRKLLEKLAEIGIVSTRDNAFLYKMHRVRGEVAHGGRQPLKRKEVERFAALTEAILIKVQVNDSGGLLLTDPEPLDNSNKHRNIDVRKQPSEDVDNQQKLLATHRRTLQHYLQQQAKLSTQYAPPGVTHGILEARQEIQRIKEFLRGWGINVEDQPDDEEPLKKDWAPIVTPSNEPSVQAILIPKIQQGSQRSLRVFLCHASGDKPAVRRLYRRLRSEGIQPWLDEEDLVGGQDWEAEIPKAVRSSDVVVVCLSRHSVNKVGYVQKEIKHALDVADEQPEGTIFIIPLKFEECDVPERLRRWHWIEHFSENGYEKLMRALRVRSTTLGLISIPEPTNNIVHTTNNKNNDKAGVLTFDSRQLAGNSGKVWEVQYDAFLTVSDFLNDIYFVISNYVSPYTYGEAWVLQDKESGHIFTSFITGWSQGHSENYDYRSLHEVGISNNMYLNIISPYEKVISTRERFANVRLTTNEIKTLKAMEEGLSLEDMANEFNLPMDTIKLFRRNIYLKLQVNTDLDAVIIARQLRAIR